MSSKNVCTPTKLIEIGLIAEETEANKTAKQKIRLEARKIRLTELKRLQKEEEAGNESSSHHDAHRKSIQSPIDLPSCYNYQKSLIDPLSKLTTSVDLQDVQTQLCDLKEKFKSIMIANSQLDNEKQVMRYNEDLLKDKLHDMSEMNAFLQKNSIEKKRELAYQRMQIAELKHELDIANEQIKAHNELLSQRDLVIINTQQMMDNNVVTSVVDGQSSSNIISAYGDVGVKHCGSSSVMNYFGSSTYLSQSNLDSTNTSMFSDFALVSRKIDELMRDIPGVNIEAKFSHLLEERIKLQARTIELQSLLEKEMVVSKLDQCGQPEGLRQSIQSARSQTQEYKYKLEQANQIIISLEGNIIRLEGQVKRYKTIAETCESQEELLKQDQRKLQREIRESHTKIEDLKSENSSLQRRLEKYLHSGTSILHPN